MRMVFIKMLKGSDFVCSFFGGSNKIATFAT